MYLVFFCRIYFRWFVHFMWILTLRILAVEIAIFRRYYVVLMVVGLRVVFDLFTEEILGDGSLKTTDRRAAI